MMRMQLEKADEMLAGNETANETLRPGLALAMLDLAERYWHLEREHARDNTARERLGA